MRTYQIRHLVGGAWVGEPTVERRNPARPDDVVARSAAGDGKTVAEAVAAAEAAQAAWAATPAPQRGTILMDAAEILARRAADVARDLTREEGKTLAEARG